MSQLLNTIKFDYKFSVDWWNRLLVDQELMNKWLCKLWKTEQDGFQDNMDAAEKYSKEGELAHHIFKITGQDEARHGDLLLQLLKERGIVPEPVQPESVYWNHMDNVVTDMNSCAAVFALGEQLAARRFEVLFDHNGTPEDVRYFLSQALPDEAYHARSFARLAGEEALEKAIKTHEEAIVLLKSS